jgi:PRTRC genetic system protein C
MTTITKLVRRFKLGATVLDDPAPDLPAEDALKLFVPNFPYLATATLGEPCVEGDVLVYPVRKPEVQVKGSRWKSPADAAVAAVETWAIQPAASPEATVRWSAVFNHIETVLDRTPSPLRDAFLIPLA